MAAPLITEADAVAALRQHWITYQVTAFSSKVVTTMWEDDDEPPPAQVPYTRTRISSSGNTGITCGRTREENRGAVFVQVFWPLTDGPGASERLASSIAAIWRTFRHPRVTLSAPSVQGLTKEGAFNRQLITIGWRADIRPA